MAETSKWIQVIIRKHAEFLFCHSQFIITHRFGAMEFYNCETDFLARLSDMLENSNNVSIIIPSLNTYSDIGDILQLMVAEYQFDIHYHAFILHNIEDLIVEFKFTISESPFCVRIIQRKHKAIIEFDQTSIELTELFNEDTMTLCDLWTIANKIASYFYEIMRYK